MRSPWIRWALNPGTGVLIRDAQRRQMVTEAETGRRSHRIARASRSCKGQEEPSLGPAEDHDPAHTALSNLWPPELGGSTFLFF